MRRACPRRSRCSPARPAGSAAPSSTRSARPHRRPRVRSAATAGCGCWSRGRPTSRWCSTGCRAPRCTSATSTDPAALARLFDGAAGASLVHAAGVIHPRRVADFDRVNAQGTRAVVEAAARAGVRRLVHVSSNSPFGVNPGPRRHVPRTTSPTGRTSATAAPRWPAELAVRAAHDAGRLETVVVRPPWFYGPWQPERQTRSSPWWRPAGSRCSGTAASGARWPTWTTWCRAWRWPSGTRPRPGAPSGSRTRAAYAMGEIVATVQRVLARGGVRSRRAAGPAARRSSAGSRRPPTGGSRPAAATRRRCTCSARWTRPSPATSPRPASVLGYDPRVALEEGMRRSVRWCRDQGIDARGPAQRRRDDRAGAGHRGQRLLRVAAGRAAAAPTGHAVRVLDLHRADGPPPDVEIVRGDIRDADGVAPGGRAASTSVFHNVAQVPLARDRALFESVNVGGTATLLDGLRGTPGSTRSCTPRRPRSSASRRPTRSRRDTPPRPVEAYGRAKADAELLCRAAVTRGLDVTVVRPRTILGHGRLGIFGILFDWIADGADVPVLGDGRNVYQFVHADDLADACVLAAAERPGPGDVQHRRRGVRHDARGGRRTCALTPARGRGCAACRSGPTSRGDGGWSRPLGLTPFAPVPLDHVQPVVVVRRRGRRRPSWAGRPPGPPTRCSGTPTTGSSSTGDDAARWLGAPQPGAPGRAAAGQARCSAAGPSAGRARRRRGPARARPAPGARGPSSAMSTGSSASPASTSTA